MKTVLENDVGMVYVDAAAFGEPVPGELCDAR